MIQIIGRSGMLGYQISRSASLRCIEVIDSYVDITCVEPKDIKAGIVINCSSVTSGPDKAKMIRINQHGPHRLALACADSGSRLVHISTDAVFNRRGPHSERDLCDPSSSYGRTKMMGEVRDPPHLTIRTSYVGLGRYGLVAQLLNTKDIIRASNEFFCSTHVSSSVAEVILELAIRESVTGLIHVPGEFQTRYQMVSRVMDILEVDKGRLVLDNSYVTDRRLISTRWKAIGLNYPPSFDDQLIDLYHDYKEVYCGSQYQLGN